MSIFRNQCCDHMLQLCDNGQLSGPHISNLECFRDCGPVNCPNPYVCQSELKLDEKAKVNFTRIKQTVPV